MSGKDQFLQIRVTPAQKSAIKEQAHRAGTDMSSYVLANLFPAPQVEFGRLVADLAGRPEQRRFVLAAIHDFLAVQSSREFLAAVAEMPVPARELEPYPANYLAAMVETAAHGHELPAPGWTQEIPPLGNPVFGSTLPGLRLHLLTHSPPAFRRRNIFIDSTIGSRV
jgi:hypothetical protein